MGHQGVNGVNGSLACGTDSGYRQGAQVRVGCLLYQMDQTYMMMLYPAHTVSTSASAMCAL
jgi:hypothetical protein